MLTISRACFAPSMLRGLAIGGIVCLLASCSKPEAQGAPPKLPVSVAKPIVKEVQEWDEYTGRFEAYDFVEVRSRVNGYLQSIHFTDGDIVEKGQLLFQIDPRPFQVALDQAKSRLTSALSAQDFAKKDLERARELLQRQNIPERVFDQRQDSLKSAQASVRSAEADVHQAELNLGYTRITAPITGRASARLISVGNLVSGDSAQAQTLTTIATLRPIRFIFDADEAAYLRYVRLAQAGERPSGRTVHHPVLVQLQGENDYSHTGNLDFVDNRIDPQTGSIRGRAVLQNDDLLLLPGMFGRLRLLGRPKYNAILIPDEAIGTDQSQRVVFVVQPDQSIQPQAVTLGPIIDGLRVVRTGLKPDQKIVINGLMRLRPGLSVEPKETQIALPKPADSRKAG